MSRLTSIVVFLAFSIFAAMSFQNCGGFLGIGQRTQGTSTGNPSLHLSFASYGSTAQGIALQNMAVVASTDPLQSVSVIFCFSNLKFKTVIGAVDDSDTQDTDQVKNISFSAREVSLSPLGTDLDFVSVPAGVYQQVTFKLNGQFCSSGNSVVVSNAQGTFTSTDVILMNFNGSQDVTLDTQEISLKIQNIVQALSTVSSASQIHDVIQAAIGNLN